MTADTRPAGIVINETEFARVANALERIATALEQSVLERIPPIAKGQVAAFADPYPSDLPFPTDEVVDLPPVRPVNPAADECPTHHQPWKTIPAGTSKKTGNPYTAFRACSVAGCDQRPRL